MKKLVKLVVTFSICACILGNDVVSVHASSEEEVVSVSVSHQHTDEGGSCYTPVYHTHSGNKYTRGGCYQGAQSSEGSSCSGTFGGTTGPFADGTYNHFCSACHRVVSSTSSTPPSGYCYAQIQRPVYALSCGKSTSSVDRYSLNCTKTDLGVVKIVKQGGVGYYLRISSNLDIDSYNWQDGSTNAIIYVTSNSTYRCEITYNDSGVQRTVSVSYEVTDYDAVPPVISAVEFSSKRVNSGVRPSVSASDNVGVVEYKMVR